VNAYTLYCSNCYITQYSRILNYEFVMSKPSSVELEVEGQKAFNFFEFKNFFFDNIISFWCWPNRTTSPKLLVPPCILKLLDFMVVKGAGILDIVGSNSSLYGKIKRARGPEKNLRIHVSTSIGVIVLDMGVELVTDLNVQSVTIGGVIW